MVKLGLETADFALYPLPAFPIFLILAKLCHL